MSNIQPFWVQLIYKPTNTSKNQQHNSSNSNQSTTNQGEKKRKPFFINIKDEKATIRDCKIGLIKKFQHRDQPKISDFQIQSGNYFAKENEDKSASTILQKLPKGVPTTFIAIQNLFRVDAISRAENLRFSFPLSFTNKLDDFKALLKERLRQKRLNIKGLDLKFFINYNNGIRDIEQLAKGEAGFDIKDLFYDPDTCAWTFLYPIKVQIRYQNESTTLICSDKDEAIEQVIQKALRQFNIKKKSSDFSLCHNHQYIKEVKIHDILKDQTEDEISLRLLQKEDLESFFILINPISGKSKISFRFPLTILTKFSLQNLIEDYFGISDKTMTLESLNDKNRKAKLAGHISESFLPGESFILKTRQLINKISRAFQIGNDKQNIDVPIDSKVKDLYSLIQKAFNTGSSIQSITINGKKVQAESYISQIYIPSHELIMVELNQNRKKTFTVNIHEKMKTRAICVDLDPDAAVVTIKDLAGLPETSILLTPENIPLNDNQSIKDALFAAHKSKFINAYVSNLYYFEYKELKCPIELTGTISNLYDKIKRGFSQKSGENYSIFLSNETGIIDPNKAIDEFPNGTIFKVNVSAQLRLRIKFKGEENVIRIDNVKFGQDLINEFAKLDGIDANALRIYSPFAKPIEPDHRLYEYFPDPKKQYSITAIKLNEFTFSIISTLKFVNLYLSFQDKVSSVINLLRHPKDKTKTPNLIGPNDTVYIVYNGQVLDKTKPLSQIFPEHTEADEESPQQQTAFTKGDKNGSLTRKQLPNESISSLDDLDDLDEPFDIYINKISFVNVTINYGNQDPVTIKIVQGTPINKIESLMCANTGLHEDRIELLENGEQIPTDTELENDITIEIREIQTTESKDPQNFMQSVSQIVSTLVSRSAAVNQRNDDDNDSEYEFDDIEIDEDELLKQAHGIFVKCSNPDEFIFNFKYINSENTDAFQLQLPKDVSVLEAKEAIVNMRNNSGENTDIDYVSITMGNTRLNDFNIFTSLTIPSTVNYFSVKITDLSKSLVFTRKS